jgi:hypothetical protein
LDREGSSTAGSNKTYVSQIDDLNSLSRLVGGGLRIESGRGAKHYVAAQSTDNCGHPVEHVGHDRKHSKHNREFAAHTRDE